MAKDDAIVVVWEVKENLGPGWYRVRLEDYGMDVTASLSGKMKNLHRISVLPGDFVDVELNPYDIKKGRIIYRHNPKKLSQTTGEWQEWSTPSATKPHAGWRPQHNRRR